MKRILSATLVLVLLLSAIPLSGIINADAAALMTAAQLQAKFPHGKYWNHAGNPGGSNSVNNQNGYTSTPCTKHGGYIGTNQQTCNGFQPGGSQLSWQCMGYAEKLGYDFTGYNPRTNANGWYTYTGSSALNSLKPGDIVRYKNDGHSIFVTGVNGDTVTYTDCNSDGHCIIKWGKTISKSTLKSSFTHVRSAPFELPSGSIECKCSTSYAGNYTCTTSSINLTIRSGHGTSYSAIGSIPPGATVYVSKASGTSNSDWAHVEYKGVSGYASMEYLKKQATHAETPTISWWLSSTEYGDSPSSFKAGNSYYFCVKLTDSMSGKLWNEVSKNNYTLKLTFYNPDGSEKFSSNVVSNNDTYWIKSFFATAGTYKYSVVLDGDFLFSGSRSFTVQDDPIKVHTSTASVSLNLNSKTSETLYIQSSGYYAEDYIFNWHKEDGKVSCSWGEWTSDHKLPLTIKAVSPGTTKVTVSIKDKDSGKVLSSVIINVTISESTKPGGSIVSTCKPLPSQTVTLYLSDDYGVAGYYWGTNSSYSGNSYTSVSGAPTNTSVTKTVSAEGTYYLAVKDTSGNVSSVSSVGFSKITLSGNGGSVSPSTIVAQKGSSIKLPVPSRSGYIFKGWSAFSSDTGGVTSITVPQANNTYYALWEPEAKPLSLNSSNNAVISSAAEMKWYNFTPSVTGKYVIYSTGNDFTEVIICNSKGTEIARDNGSGEGDNFRLECNLTAGTEYVFRVGYKSTTKTGTISFKFGKVYTVNYDANGGKGAPNVQHKDYGTPLVLSSTIPTKDGYKFVGWAINGTADFASYKADSTYSTDADITLYAVWRYVDSSKPEAAVYSTNNVASDQTVTLEMSDDTGLAAYYWGTECNPADKYFTTLSNVKSKSVTKTVFDSGTYYLIAKDTSGNKATTSVKFCKVSLDADGGEVTPENIIVRNGNTVLLPTPERSGYIFNGWGTTPSAADKVESVKVTSDVSYYAKWSDPEFEFDPDLQPGLDPVLKPEHISGDVNCDGMVDAGDAVLISVYDAGKVTLTSVQLLAGDVNKDGVVDAGDAVVISRYDAGFIDKLG